MLKRICRVLVVEDNDDIRSLLEDTFAYEGYRFICVPSGEEMRSILAQGDVDIVIIDVTLRAGESGLALAEEVAQQNYPVILVSGDHTHAASITETGRHRFLAKPFRLRSLVELVDEALEEAQADCEVKQRAVG
jgi:two-component system, OmpR family, torCAD operon response regulator TorR